VKKEVKEEVDGETSTSASLSHPSLRVILPAAFASPLTRPNYPLLQQIHTETSAKLTLNPSVLPLSTERLLIISAPSPNSISLAVTRISDYLQSSYEHYASIQNGAKPPVVYYVPLPVYGTMGAPENYDLPRVIEARMMTPQNPYGINPKQPLVPQQAAVAGAVGGAQGAAQGVGGQVYQQGPTQVPGPTVGAQPHGIQPAVVGPGGQLTQQIFIPNDMVGAIIGKGGAKINEIRQMSGSHMYVPSLSTFFGSSMLIGVVKSMSRLRTAMSDWLRLRVHRMRIRWRCICYIPDLKLKSIECRTCRDIHGKEGLIFLL
jgi:heterogeneous nuclear rnp K-like protein 2